MGVFFLAVGVFFLSMLGTRIVLFFLRRYRVMDIPNTRSNHAAPTPRGGGIAVMIAVITGSAGVFLLMEPGGLSLWPTILGMLALSAVSFYDDMRGLPVSWRFGVQLAVIVASLYVVPSGLLFGGVVPPVIEHLLIGGAWLWFVNLYNFMDGIDGITGSETVCIGAGVLLCVAMAGLLPLLGAYGLVIAAAAGGFLVWNWHPAKIFLGDVGSVPLGYFTFWLLLQLAGEGAWAAALILPGYYLADSTWTLGKRVLQGERFWEAHSKHFYQQAVRSGYSHSHVVRMVMYANTALVALALISLKGGGYLFFGLAGAVGVIALLFHKWQRCGLTKKQLDQAD